jgi:hypothetical protein
MSDTTATTKAPEGEAVGRFRMSIVHGESTQASDELWDGRASALARWLVSEWMRERENPECVRIEAEVNSERRAGA